MPPAFKNIQWKTYIVTLLFLGSSNWPGVWGFLCSHVYSSLLDVPRNTSKISGGNWYGSRLMRTDVQIFCSRNMSLRGRLVLVHVWTRELRLINMETLLLEQRETLIRLCSKMKMSTRCMRKMVIMQRMLFK